ncbi:MAG: hypothetical protein K0S68_127 [Candidatus Saccharibacteria bacterium]|nr:hypothetical protein [Candidatus Saccharibacteria bacterium]
MATTQALKPFGELFNAAINNYRSHFKTILGVSAVLAVVYVIIALISPDAKVIGRDQITSGDILLVALSGIAYVLAAIWVTVSLLLMVHDRAKHPSVSDLLNASTKYLAPVIVASLIAGFLTLLGFIALVIPGIIVGVWFTFVTQVVVFENKRGTAALEQSRAHVRGRWWAVFGRYLLFALVIIGAMIVFSFVSLMFTFFLPRGVQQSVVDLFSIFVVAPVATLFTYELYKSASAAHHKPLES